MNRARTYFPIKLNIQEKCFEIFAQASGDIWQGDLGMAVYPQMAMVRKRRTDEDKTGRSQLRK